MSSARQRGEIRHHLLSVLVENKAGVLARVAGLFSRRGYNIFSLAVAPTDDARFSRISIVVDVESAPLEQVVAQLDKLINVVEISELHPSEAREAELVLCTVAADADERAQVIQLVGVFGGSIVDVSLSEITVMLAGSPDSLDDFEELMRPYGIAGLQRSGRIALPKLDASAERRLQLLSGVSPVRERLATGPETEREG
ncbi:MAG: acetolactate synthase small subunit [Acidimicrobiales bacterium]